MQHSQRSNRKVSGGKYHEAHKKRKHRLGRIPIETKIGEERKKIVRTRGGNIKIKSYSMDQINVTDTKANNTTRVPIKGLDVNTASVDYQRRSILTKGAVVETKLGKVKITSRPGQTGQLNGILLE